MRTSSTERLPLGKRVLFYGLLWSPLVVVLVIGGYLALHTSLLQLVYLDSLRNMYYDCLHLTEDGTVYKARPGVCTLNNLEYRTTLTHDAQGFRNEDTLAASDVVLIGDSHTHGFGVNDHETFTAVLRDRYHLRVKNLAIASYATMRELEALQQYTHGEKVVVIQYCDNDLGENMQSIRYPRDDFLARVKGRWTHAAQEYEHHKKLGWRAPAIDLARRLIQNDYASHSAYAAQRLDRNVGMEAHLFALLLARYRSVLEGKHVLVFESSSYGLNHSQFQARFSDELARVVPGLDVQVLDTSRQLERSDYFWLDDHLNVKGHAQVASMLSAAIAQRGAVTSPHVDDTRSRGRTS